MGWFLVLRAIGRESVAQRSQASRHSLDPGLEYRYLCLLRRHGVIQIRDRVLLMRQLGLDINEPVVVHGKSRGRG